MNGLEKRIIYSLVAIILALQTAIASYGFSQLGSILDRVNSISTRVAVIEGFLLKPTGEFGDWNSLGKQSSLKGQGFKTE